ncbi:uncharacterized protein LOC108735989 [Agrilus planipennis]|uniref:Uncharacterized protein LOC108735989 n=1 Tax=Agrilus planipennis TaxID=224129 RepID=A0A1W4WIH7_AGRPL|nr:uncharacterized protein LOC108735989 [Agrilus planipennis]
MSCQEWSSRRCRKFLPGMLVPDVYRPAASLSVLKQLRNKSDESAVSAEKGLLQPLAKGSRLIIIHAGGKMAFIENACLIYKSGLKTVDYHVNMNYNNYRKWVQEKLLPNLSNCIKLLKFKIYDIDEIIQKAGHDVLRLPSYHPELNPIEYVWAALKHFVTERNVSFNLGDVKKLCEEFFSIEKWERVFKKLLSKKMHTH